MPIEFRQNSSGQWEAVGALTEEESNPLQDSAALAKAEKERKDRQRAIGAKATLNKRAVVWAGPDLGWQSPASFEKAKKDGKVPGQGGDFWRALGNAVIPEQLRENVAAGSIPQLLSGKKNILEVAANELTWGAKQIPGVARDVLVRQFVPTPLTGNSPLPIPPSQYEKNIRAAASIGVVDNATKAFEAAGQALSGQPSNPGQNRTQQQIVNGAYRLLGAKPPDEMTKGEAELDSFMRSASLNVATSVGVGLAGKALGIGAATTFSGGLVRGGGLFATEEVISTGVDDNRGGNVVNLAESLFGQKAGAWGGVKPTDTWGAATAKSILPNAIAGGLFGLIGGGAADLLKLQQRTGIANPLRVTGAEVADVAGEAPDQAAKAPNAGSTAEAVPPNRPQAEEVSPAVEAADGAVAEEATATPLPNQASRRWNDQNRTIMEIRQARQWAEQQGLIGPERADGVQVNRLSEPEVTTQRQRDLDRQRLQQEQAQRQQQEAAQPSESSTPGIELPEAAQAAPAPEAQGAAAPRQAQPAADPWGESGSAAPADGFAAKQADPGVVREGSQVADPWGSGESAAEVKAAGPQVDPDAFDPAANPELIETDQLVRDVFDLDDEALKEIADGGTTTSVVDQVASSRKLQRDNLPQYDERFADAAAELTMAPGQALGFDLESYRLRLNEFTTNELRSLTDPVNNPFAARWIEATTGRTVQAARRADMIDALRAQAWSKDQFVVPRSYAEGYRPGEFIVALSDLQVEPSRFQFRQGADPISGVAPERSLADEQFWDTELEGEILVWPDGDGGYRLVDGHGRVAQAQRLGIPSLPARVAKTSKDSGAKVLGAAKNIAEGSASAMETADHLRSLQLNTLPEVMSLHAEIVNTPAGLELVTDGLALNRLPDELRARVKSGGMDVDRGVVIGNANRSPEEMITIARFADQRRVGAGELREMLDLADSAGDLKAPKGQIFWEFITSGAPGATEMLERLERRAALWSRVRVRLNADQELGSLLKAEVSPERPSYLFDRLKNEQGPVNQRLREAAELMEAGEPLDAAAAEAADAIAGAMKSTEMTRQAERAAANAVEQVVLPSPEALADANKARLTPSALQKRQARVAELLAKGEEAPLTTREKSTLANYQQAITDHEAAVELLDQQKRAEAAGANAARVAAEAETPQVQDLGPVRLTAEQREEMRRVIVQRAIDNGETRAVVTPIPDLPAGPSVTTTQATESLIRDGLVPGSDAAQGLADEIRLQMDQIRAQEAAAKAARENAREQTGYYAKSIQARIQSGEFTPGFEDTVAKQKREGIYVEIPPDAVAPLSKSNSAKAMRRNTAKELNRWLGISEEDALAAVDAKRKVLDLNQLPGVSFADAMKDRVAGRQTDATRAIDRVLRQFYEIGPDGYDPPARMRVTADGLVPDGSAPAAPIPVMSQLDRAEAARLANGFVMPQSMRSAAPRWKRFEVEFQSDLDRAAFILAGDSKKGSSRGATKLKNSLRQQGLDPEAVAIYGRNTVTPALKELESNAGESVTRLDLPAQQFGGKPPTTPDSRQAWMKTRQQKVDIAANKKAELELLIRQSQSGGCN